jgi:hypothetical protein
MAHRVFTDLDLHEDVPVRARPRLGEWGPQGVESTTHKKVIRVVVPILAALALAALITVGYFVFQAIRALAGM